MIWRYLLAFILSMAVLWGWMWLFPPPKPVHAPPPAPAQVAGAPAAPNVGNPAPQPAAQAAAPTAPAEQVALPKRERKSLSLSLGDRYRIGADSMGGCLSTVSLGEYTEAVNEKDPYTLLRTPSKGPGILTLEVEDPSNPAKPSVIPFEASWTLELTSPDGAPPVFVYQYDLDAISITKTVSPGGPEFPGEGPAEGLPRHLKVTLEFQNKGTTPAVLTYRLFGAVGIDSENHQSPGSDIELVSGSWDAQSVVAEASSAAKIVHKDLSTGRLAWVALSNTYFTAALFPLPVEPGRQAGFVERAFADSYPDEHSLDQLALEKHGRVYTALSPQEAGAVLEKAYKNLRVAIRSTKVTLAPGGAPLRHEYGFYLGPKEKSALARFEALGLGSVDQHGTIARFFTWLLGVLKSVTMGSWGLAIILLTFIVKLCLHPINRKTQASMQRFQKKMQRIKPQMDELKERFAGNRQRMTIETQKLWKEHGVNPGQQMAGCLVMFLQLPIWYGLYGSLQSAIGLRQASFLYIQDLTKPDMLCRFGFTMPFLGQWFNLLPLLYVILTIVSQRMQPKPDDPQMRQQYNMMTIMMAGFGYLFYQSPSGFILYIMTSAALGIIESKIIKAELRREDERGGLAIAGAGAGGPAPGGAMYPARSRQTEDARSKRGGRG